MIGILADLGIAGMLLWLLLLGTGLYAVLGAWRTTRRHNGGSDGFFLVQAITYAYALQALAFSWYTPTQDSKEFWFILALTIVVGKLAHRRPQSVGASLPETHPLIGSRHLHAGTSDLGAA